MVILFCTGADPLAKDESGNTPLHVAAFSGYGVAVQAILEQWVKERMREENNWESRYIVILIVALVSTVREGCNSVELMAQKGDFKDPFNFKNS